MADVNNLEVYVYRGNKGEQVPGTVEKLIVQEDVQALPDYMCCEYQHLREVSLPYGLKTIGKHAFQLCGNLLEITISNTVQWIGNAAFKSCQRLKQVKFECSESSTHQLVTIGEHAFGGCSSLQRIKPPSSVTSLRHGSVFRCTSLLEVNLSTTGINEIPPNAFLSCYLLETASFPKTLQEIGSFAFVQCRELVTVAVPLDSQPLRIGRGSFASCRKLANLSLPKDSTAEENSFIDCHLLCECYGEESSLVVNRLIGRFEDFPIHQMCYDHSQISTPKLRQCIVKHQEQMGSLVDEFGMTPFHILFSTVDPRGDVLEILLESLPNQILKWKDANGRRPMYYLITNWTDLRASLLRTALQKSIMDPLENWGDPKWSEEMKTKAGKLLFEKDKDRRATLCNEMYSTFEHYENIQGTSLLEMAMWKWKLKSGRTSDGTKRLALDRDECRCLSGADFAIPQVVAMLGIQPSGCE